MISENLAHRIWFKNSLHVYAVMVMPKKGYKFVRDLFGKEIEIPEEWTICVLEKLSSIRKERYTESELYVGLEHISQNTNILINKGNNSQFNSTKNVFKKGDVLYGKLRPLLNKVWLSTENGYCSTDILPIQTNKKLSNILLLKILSSNDFVQYASSRSAGTKMPRTNWFDIKKYMIKLPQRNEQQKIASILSGVDALIESTQKVIEKTKKVKKALMQNLLTRGISHKKFKLVKESFGKFEEIPEEWKILKFGNIAQIRRGASPRPIEDPKYFGHGRGWIRISDVSKSNKYLMQTRDYLSKLGETKSVAVNEGDVIMSIAATVGKPIIVKMQACIHDGFIAFLNLSEEINNEYLYYLLKLNRKFTAMGQHGTQSNINSELVSKTKFYKPSFQEQQKIASILSGVDAMSYTLCIMLRVIRIVVLMILIIISANEHHYKIKKPTR